MSRALRVGSRVAGVKVEAGLGKGDGDCETVARQASAGSSVGSLGLPVKPPLDCTVGQGCRACAVSRPWISVTHATHPRADIQREASAMQVCGPCPWAFGSASLEQSPGGFIFNIRAAAHTEVSFYFSVLTTRKRGHTQ